MSVTVVNREKAEGESHGESPPSRTHSLQNGVKPPLLADPKCHQAQIQPVHHRRQEYRHLSPLNFTDQTPPKKQRTETSSLTQNKYLMFQMLKLTSKRSGQEDKSIELLSSRLLGYYNLTHLFQSHL